MVLNKPAGEPGSGPGACRADDVPVVGAGPVGLVAAVEPARREVRVRIVDAAAGPASGSPNGSGRRTRALVQAGERAPDALLQAPDRTAVRIFDLFRGTHVSLVALGNRSAEVVDAVARRGPHGLRPFTVLAPGTDHGVDEDDTLFVVRPDGYVGLRAVDPEGTEILRYLERLLPTVQGRSVGSPRPRRSERPTLVPAMRPADRVQRAHRGVPGVPGVLALSATRCEGPAAVRRGRRW
ncbi:hypothetical protein AB0399_23215 [Streptomyces sp. NPDC088194]|uniref:aromatic-ring hydroxylase C-terminal domain-containing protein n=1 Tax=Streptomyces sp. NPDC088194 TaxID=3154931 RepID=UPI00344FC0AE